MIKFSTLIALPDSYSFFTVAFIAIAFLSLGLLVKFGLLAKAKSRILKLEDEMLSNHARILKLEKKLAEAQNENARNNNNSRIIGNDVQEKKITGLERKAS